MLCPCFARSEEPLRLGCHETTLTQATLPPTPCPAGKIGRSAAIEQVPVPAAQMVQKQDWRYVSNANQVLRAAHAQGVTTAWKWEAEDCGSGRRCMLCVCGLGEGGGEETVTANDTTSCRLCGDQALTQLLPAHHALPGSEITSLAMSRDGTRLISRAGDDTLKVWDLRSFKKPLAVFDDLDTTFPNTQVATGWDATFCSDE